MKKELGQVWTPQWMVQRILDISEFTVDNIQSKIKSNTEFKILEPSFGNADFIIEIIDRITLAAANLNLNKNEIAKILQDSIYAVEFDNETFISSMHKIKKHTYSKIQTSVDYTNIIEQDFLLYASNMIEENKTFDYIVGNPPYIRLHDLPHNVREQLKTLSTATGTTDLYIAFYEQGYNLLTDTGSLVFIAPNTWQKNASQKSFRKSIINNNAIAYIEDYTHYQVFKDASIYVSIMKLTKETKKQFSLQLVKITDYSILEFHGEPTYVDYSKVTDPSKMISEIIEQTTEDDRDYILLEDICNIQNGVSTLQDKTFTSFDMSQNVDTESLKYLLPCVKGSKYNGNNTETIIFPYKKHENKYIPITEEELQKAVSIYEYLLPYQSSLAARNLDKNALWFHYGRSQAIQKTEDEKMVISPFLNPDKEIRSYILPKNHIIYSGMFITIKDNSYDLNKIQEIVNSEEFINHIEKHGKNKRGGYVEFSTPVMKSFKIYI